MQNEAKFLTIAQAAKFLNVSPDTLRRWEDKGIVTPQRTKGGSRRYTLLDLKIAKLNKKKMRGQNYVNSQKNFQVALLTSLLWIVGLLAYNFLPPLFLRPANLEQQIISDQLKDSTRLKIASEICHSDFLFCHPENPAKPETKDLLRMQASFTTISQGSDLLISRFNDLPTLRYSDIPSQYYFLKPLPQNQITTLIKRT